MAKLSMKAGTTSSTVNLFIQDSSSTTGAGKTGLAFNTASLTAYYSLPKAAAVSITLATQTVTGAWSSGGFVEIDATNMPGWYRFDIPNAALASGTFSSIHFKGAANMAPLPLEIELTAVDNQSATGFVSSVPAVVGAVGSVTGAVGSVTGAVGSIGAGGISASSFAAGAIDNAAIAADAIGASELATTAVNEIADGILGRNIGGGSSVGRIVKDALSFLRNKWTISGTTLTVYDTDDTSVLWTAVIAGTAGADPVTSSDPA